jgi:alanyl-tRNA synthetase
MAAPATDRLYYVDPNTSEFDATVVEVQVDKGLARVRLDRTCFYPTTGGQPFDTGTLGSHRVVDVMDDEAGDVVHVVDLQNSDKTAGQSGELRVASRVRGVIDWPRRFDHMQQHTGQHILSAALVRLLEVPTVSFHLGSESSTIDLPREVSARDLARAEDEANGVVWQDRPVTIRFVTAEEAARLPLRKEPVRGGTLRLIDIADFDLSACGGTHVTRTGQIGIIAVTAWERFKGGQRVEFRCGRRALERLRSLREATSSAGKLLSVRDDELPGAIERLQQEAKASRRQVSALHADLARYKADELVATAEPTASGRLAFAAFDAEAGTLKSLASAVTARNGLVAVLVSSARPALVVVARSADVPVAANEILARLTAKFGGRGGGKADLAQGGGLDASPEAIRSAVVELVR